MLSQSLLVIKIYYHLLIFEKQSKTLDNKHTHIYYGNVKSAIALKERGIL